ncbi:MAG: hypothetical protein IPO09_19100 [Anaeromyxobacter sp.]|nr:hypothetical protein [Anaeromyxobacter sp.]
MSSAHDPAARFARQQALPGYGEAGLPRLARARVHVVGRPAGQARLLSLARAGIGTLCVDDGGDADPWDAGGWLYAPVDQGRSRVLSPPWSWCAPPARRWWSGRSPPTPGRRPPRSAPGNEAVARTAAKRAG